MSNSIRKTLLLAVAFELGLAVIAVFAGQVAGVRPLASVGSWGTANGYLPLIGLSVTATLPLLAGLIALERLDWPAICEIRKFIRDVLSPLLAPLSPFGLGLISAAAGIGEETLFRGFLQAGLVDWLPAGWGIYPAIGISATAFGLVHLITPTYAVLATAAGIYFGWLFHSTGDLAVPMIAHALYDFVALMYLVKRS